MESATFDSDSSLTGLPGCRLASSTGKKFFRVSTPVELLETAKYITVTGVLTGFFPNPAGEGQYEITGGTGRFEGASGSGSFDANTERALYEGSITFSPGSTGSSGS